MTGEIDYKRLFQFLADRGTEPHLVLEQAVEAKSSRELTASEAHTMSRERLRRAIG